MKKENVIESARLLFHKYGFKKVSMDEIAREANVTKKTIYSIIYNFQVFAPYYFPF